MKFNLVPLCVVMMFGTAFSQKFKIDKNGYINDRQFHALIKQRNYQLVSAFDTVQMDSAKVMLSTVVKENKIYNIDLSGNELTYYDENEHQIMRREKALNGPYEILTKKYKELNVHFPRQYKLLHKEGKYGLAIAKNDSVLLEPKYDGIWPYKDLNLISIEQNKKKGIIDTLGNTLINMEYDYLIPCVIDTFEVKYFVGHRNNLATLVNLKGKELFPPKYNSITAFSANGLLITTAYDKNQKALRGLLDKNGKVIIEPSYNEFTSIPNSTLIRTHLEGSSIAGLIDRNGKIILDVSFDFISISEAEPLIMVKKNRKIGYLDRSGNIVVPVIYDRVLLTDNLSPIIVGNEVGAGAVKPLKYGLIDAKGKELIQLEYDELFAADDFFIGKKGMIYCKIARTGQVIKMYEHQSMRYIGDHLIITKNKDGHFGVIDTKERVVIPFVYSQMQKMAGLYFATNKGIIDIDNHVVRVKTWQELTWTNDLALRKPGVFVVEANGFPGGVLCLDRYGNSYNTKGLRR